MSKYVKNNQKCQKKSCNYWHFTKTGVIVTIFVLLIAEVCTSDEASDIALQEARLGRETAEKRMVELEIELEQSKKALEQIRSRYASLYLEGHGLVRSLRQTELQIANLWHTRNSNSMGDLAERLIEVLDKAANRQLAVAQTLERYEKSLNTLLDVLQPGQALRQELADRLEELKMAVEKSIQPLIHVSDFRYATGENGGRADARKGCRVTAEDAELLVVLLDAGSLAGVQPGSIWKLVAEGKVVATFQVVDVRSAVSAAVLVSGNLADVPVGSILLPVEGTAGKGIAGKGN